MTKDQDRKKYIFESQDVEEFCHEELGKVEYILENIMSNQVYFS